MHKTDSVPPAHKVRLPAPVTHTWTYECVGYVNSGSPGNRGSASPTGGQKVARPCSDGPTGELLDCSLACGSVLKWLMEGLTPNNLCPHVTFTCKGRKPAVCGILTKPGLKIHNLGCVYFVELALTAFSHHKVLSRASIYICNFTFLKFFNLTFCLS